VPLSQTHRRRPRSYFYPPGITNHLHTACMCWPAASKTYHQPSSSKGSHQLIKPDSTALLSPPLSTGPALAAGGNARIAFVPDTPEVASLVRRLAMAVSCPTEAYKRICSAASITTFACLFGVQQAPAACQVRHTGPYWGGVRQ
jgi:hypothetical protein